MSEEENTSPEAGIQASEQEEKKKKIYWKWIVLIVIILLLALDLTTGIIRVAWIEINSWNNLTRTGLRFGHLERLSKAGMIGRARARDYALSWYGHGSPYGVFFILGVRSLWKGYSQNEMRNALGKPKYQGENYDIWEISDKHREENEPPILLAVEYENSMYKRMGLANGSTPSDDDAKNKPYLLKGDYKQYEPKNMDAVLTKLKEEGLSFEKTDQVKLKNAWGLIPESVRMIGFIDPEQLRYFNSIGNSENIFEQAIGTWGYLHKIGVTYNNVKGIYIGGFISKEEPADFIFVIEFDQKFNEDDCINKLQFQKPSIVTRRIGKKTLCCYSEEWKNKNITLFLTILDQQYMIVSTFSFIVPVLKQYYKGGKSVFDNPGYHEIINANLEEISWLYFSRSFENISKDIGEGRNILIDAIKGNKNNIIQIGYKFNYDIYKSSLPEINIVFSNEAIPNSIQPKLQRSIEKFNEEKKNKIKEYGVENVKSIFLSSSEVKGRILLFEEGISIDTKNVIKQIEGIKMPEIRDPQKPVEVIHPYYLEK